MNATKAYDYKEHPEMPRDQFGRPIPVARGFVGWNHLSSILETDEVIAERYQSAAAWARRNLGRAGIPPIDADEPSIVESEQPSA